MSVDYYLMIVDDENKRVFNTYIGSNLNPNDFDYRGVVDAIDWLDDVLEEYPAIDEKPITDVTLGDIAILVDIYRKLQYIKAIGPSSWLSIAFKVYGIIATMVNGLWWKKKKPTWEIISYAEIDDILEEYKKKGYTIIEWER